SCSQRRRSAAVKAWSWEFVAAPARLCSWPIAPPATCSHHSRSEHGRRRRRPVRCPRLSDERGAVMSDWTSEAADTVERVVTTVRDRTVVPVQSAARAVVYGLLAAFFVITALLLLAIMVFRLLSIALPVWAAWLIVGGISVIAGGFCWSRRSPRPALAGGTHSCTP